MCKDFIIDPIQITAARSHGADAILLMLSVLDDQDYTELSLAAHRLGLDVLTEVDSEEDMRRAQRLGARIIGINNRDLRTLQIDITRTQKLAPLAPQGAVIVGESGVHSRDDVMTLAPYVDALLVGSSLSGSDDPTQAAWEITGGQPSAGHDFLEEVALHTSWRPYSGERLGAKTEGTTDEETPERPTKLSPYFGQFGGQYVPELLIPALDQLEEAFVQAIDDPTFIPFSISSWDVPPPSQSFATFPVAALGSSSSVRTWSTEVRTRVIRFWDRLCWLSAWVRRASSLKPEPANTGPQPQWCVRSWDWNARSTWARSMLFGRPQTSSVWNSWAQLLSL